MIFSREISQFILSSLPLSSLLTYTPKHHPANRQILRSLHYAFPFAPYHLFSPVVPSSADIRVFRAVYFRPATFITRSFQTEPAAPSEQLGSERVHRTSPNDRERRKGRGRVVFFFRYDVGPFLLPPSLPIIAIQRGTIPRNRFSITRSEARETFSTMRNYTLRTGSRLRRANTRPDRGVVDAPIKTT